MSNEKQIQTISEITPIDDSIKELSTDIGSLIDKSNRFLQIFSRAGSSDNKSLVEFSTIGDTELDQIVEKMPMINEGTKAFGKQNSQVTGRLMSLTMLATSPYHRMKQCLAKIERKRSALKENIFKLRRDKIELDQHLDTRDGINEDIKKLQDQLDTVRLEDNVNSNSDEKVSVAPSGDYLEQTIKQLNYKLQLVEIDIEEKVANIADSNIYVEAALKEIGHYQTAYEQIMKNHNISEDWDEKDFEESEIEEHIKMAFLHGIRDVMMSGRLNVGTHEYLEQFGIHPYTAYILIQNYLGSIEKLAKENKFPGVENMYKFLDEMYTNFKDEYKKTVEHIGLDHLLDDTFLYKSKEFTGEE